MIQDQVSKLVSIVPPAAIVDNAAVTCASLDTLGFEYAKIVVYFGAMDIAATVLKVGESDTDGSYVDILAFGTDNQITGAVSVLPSATDDNKFFVFQIDMRGRKRYLKLAITCGDGAAGTYVTAWAELGRPNKLPTIAADFGASQVMRLPA